MPVCLAEAEAKAFVLSFTASGGAWSLPLR